MNSEIRTETVGPKKLHLRTGERFYSRYTDAIDNGRTSQEVTDALADAWHLAEGGNDKEAGDVLRGLLVPPAGEPFDAADYLRAAKAPAVAVHVGVTRPVDHCPFGRDVVGIDASVEKPEEIVERTFAEWRLSAKTLRDRHTVIIYSAGEPIAMYRNVTWGRSPDELPNGEPGRHNKGRHYVADAQVTLFGPGLTFTMTTGPDADGFIRPEIVDGRPWDQYDPVLAYVASHQRQRPTVQQPVDLLGM